MKATTEVDYIKVEDTLEGVAEFLGQEVVLSEEGFKLQSSGKNWNVQVGDFIVKNPVGFLVYKPERFEKDFKVQKIKENPKPTAKEEIKD